MATVDDSVLIRFELTDCEALALAQLCKRIGFGELRINAVNEIEAYSMGRALERVREGLAREGYAPR